MIQIMVRCDSFDERTMMSAGWVLALIAAVVLAVNCTLAAALLMIREGLRSIATLCTSIVQSLMGQSADEDGVVFDADVGNSSGLFETLPAWQFWDGSDGDDPDENPIGVQK